jgi:hypothetical protein
MLKADQHVEATAAGQLSDMCSEPHPPQAPPAVDLPAAGGEPPASAAGTISYAGTRRTAGRAALAAPPRLAYFEHLAELAPQSSLAALGGGEGEGGRRLAANVQPSLLQVRDGCWPAEVPLRWALQAREGSAHLKEGIRVNLRA